MMENAGTEWTPARRWIFAAGLFLTLVLLGAHAREYAFLTDDAFISFRYARNLAEGNGLVFNPGLERVEGYTNFLWVLILASFDWMGLAPERISNVLTLGFTIGLWGLVVWHVLREELEEHHWWLPLVPLLFLAATRSIAVWSTGGLETRLFEILVLGGTLRLIVEVRGFLEGDVRAPPLSGCLFGLATLTRPDGLLIALSVYAVAMAFMARRGFRRAFSALLMPLGLFGLLVAGHFLFRFSYYGDWLPNTYYAKVGGRSWWSMGLSYLALFVLEYGIYLWAPLLLGAIAYHLKRRSAYVPAIFAAVILPHLVYVVAIGGDHFEFRPFDLYFPFLFLLLSSGAKHWARGGLWTTGTAAYLLGILIALVALPYQSHRQYPSDRYRPGFPGSWIDVEGAAAEYMKPERDPIYRLFGLRFVANAHQSLLQTTTAAFVGVRAEEHEAFLETVVPTGRALGKLAVEGVLPRNTRIAIDSVGAIPYYSGLPTLDRLGLTDGHVSRTEARRQMFLAHDKRATFSYGRRWGADFWASHFVHPIFRVTDPEFLELVAAARKKTGDAYLAEVDAEHYLLARLPQGLDHARGKFASLDFFSANDDEAVREVFRRATQACDVASRRNPRRVDLHVARAIAAIQLDRLGAAVESYERVLEIEPDRVETLAALGRLLVQLGRLDAAAERFLRLADLEPAAAGHLSLGNVRMLQGRTSEAIRHYQESLRRRPQNLEAHLNLANAFAQAGELGHVIRHYREALRIQPHHADAHYVMGNIRASQGRVGLAMAHYTDALNSKPNMAEARQRLEALRARQRDAGDDDAP